MTEKMPDPTLQQAVAWLHRIKAAPEDAALRNGLECWIAADETHRAAWALARKAWTLAGDVPPRFAGRRVFGRMAGAKRLRHRSLAAGIAAALAACSLIFVAAPEIAVRLRADSATAAAEMREIALEDGSAVTLGAGSAIATDFSAGRRAVTLLRGEAFFRVVRDPARPFTAQAETLTVTVTGTAFDVGFTDRSYAVTVASGAVRVAHAGAAGTRDVALSPGQRLVIDRRTGDAVRTAVAAEDIAPWRAGRLIVEDAALPDVVDAIRRHHRGAVLVISRSLRERRVTGVYDLSDPVRALRALAGPYGGVIREVPPYLITVSDF
jgi:transmembrane sensor